MGVMDAALNGGKMTKQEKLDKVEAFKTELIAVCHRHGMYLEPMHEELDEYSSEDSLRIVIYANTYVISSAYMDAYDLRYLK